MTRSTRFTLRDLVAVIALLGAPACGGNAFSSKEATDGGAGPSTSASSGGTSSTATSASTTSAGGAVATATGTTATTGSGGDVCRQSITPGQCNAFIPAYGFNAETGLCESFVYGGCGGNDNRFETLEACLDACAPGGLTACNTHADCVIDRGCCGICQEPSLEILKAANRAYDSSRAPECLLLDCDYCDPPGLEQFGARCSMGHCEVYDVRESELSACETDDDCHLRNGLGCCESCSGDDWVAISIDPTKLSELACGDEPAACPPCVAIPPEPLGAACGANGHCAVVSAQ